MVEGQSCWEKEDFECAGYDIILDLIQVLNFGECGALPLLPGPLWPRVVVLFWFSSKDQIELLNHLLRIIIIIIS